AAFLSFERGARMADHGQSGELVSRPESKCSGLGQRVGGTRVNPQQNFGDTCYGPKYPRPIFGVPPAMLTDSACSGGRLPVAEGCLPCKGLSLRGLCAG